MPDYFVPVDTSSFSDYYRDLISLGIFNRFILQYVDEHRDEFLSEYTDFKSFKKDFKATEMHTDALISFAADEDLAFDQEQWDISGEQISLLMKGYLARALFDMTKFYEVYNTSNAVFNKAVEILDKPDMFSEKLANAESE